MCIHSKIIFCIAAALSFFLNDNLALASDSVTDDEEQEEDTLQIPSVWPTPWTVVAIILSVLQVALVLWSILFMYAIVSSSKVRSVPYNIYLVFLVLPDAMLNLVSAIIPMVRTFAGESVAMIYILIWTSAFYYTSNFWLNFTIAYEIHKLAKQTYQATLQTLKSSTSNNTEPAGPSLRKVYKQCLGLYLIAILTATWFALPVPWSPMHVGGDGSQTAKFGSPQPGGVFTSMMGFLIVVIFIMLVPTIYVLYVRFNLWRRQLLPKTGKTRVLSLYFMRILVVFFAFYYPSIIVSLVRSRTKSEAFWFASNVFKRILEIAQASTTIYIASQKEDVKMAIYEAAGCCCKKRREALSSENTNNDEVISENHISEWHDDDVYDDEQRKNARKSKKTEDDNDDDEMDMV